MKNRLYVLCFFLFAICCFAENSYSIVSSKIQFNPKNCFLTLANGKFHENMDEGPLLVVNNYAFCSQKGYSQVLMSQVLAKTDDALVLEKMPEEKVLIDNEDKKELAPLSSELFSKYGTGLAVFEIRTRELTTVDQQKIPVHLTRKIVVLSFLDKDEMQFFALLFNGSSQLLDLSTLGNALGTQFQMYRILPNKVKCAFLKGSYYPLKKKVPFEAYHKTKFVDLQKIGKNLFFDIRYASDNNFTHKQVYPEPICLLHEEVALALINANKQLNKQGYALMVYDAYRPLTCQSLFWEVMSNPSYVAYPPTGSMHNRGCAVDVMLVTLAGDLLEMPTAFDDFSKKAAAYSTVCSLKAQKYRTILQNAMVDNGFEILDSEWWHFQFKGWENYPVTDFYKPVVKLRKK